MLFYRVEDFARRGMYTRSNGLFGCLREHELNFDDPRHPEPEEDSQLMRRMKRDIQMHDDRFAFASLEQLKFWLYMKEMRQYLHGNGYRVAVIEATGWHGDTQAVYLHSTRKDVETLSLLEI